MYCLRSTPQYSLSKGMNVCWLVGYDVTLSELNSNLFRINSLDMLVREQITKDVCINILSYLMFLKRERIGNMKARGKYIYIYIGKYLIIVQCTIYNNKLL